MALLGPEGEEIGNHRPAAGALPIWAGRRTILEENLRREAERADMLGARQPAEQRDTRMESRARPSAVYPPQADMEAANQAPIKRDAHPLDTGDGPPIAAAPRDRLREALEPHLTAIAAVLDKRIGWDSSMTVEFRVNVDGYGEPHFVASAVNVVTHIVKILAR
jgi:hypothetical protein